MPVLPARTLPASPPLSLRQRVAAALALAAWALGAHLLWGGLGSLDESLWMAPDARTYRDVAEWITGGPATDSTLIRPFFYPALLAVSTAVLGWAGPFVLNVAAWLGAGVALMMAVERVAPRRRWWTAAGALYASNLSLLLLTRQALTENVTALLLALFALVLTTRRTRRNPRTLLAAVLLAALLTATKPVYVLLLIPSAAYAAVASLRVRSRRLAYGAGLLLCLVPVAVQLGIMRHQHGLWALSTIGERAIADYFVPRVYADANGVAVEEARALTDGLAKTEARSFLLHRPAQALRTFAGLVVENVAARSNVIDPGRRLPYLYMRGWNAGALLLHLAMLVPVLLALRRWVRTRAWDRLEVGLGLLLPFGAVVLTAGLTYWQGDRIVLPVLPVWVVLYALVLGSVRPTAPAPRS